MTQLDSSSRCVVILSFLLGAWGCSSTPPTSLVIETIQRVPLQSIQVDGQPITYVETGHGAPVILIHGFGGSIWNWEHQQANLSSHYRVITLDLLGSGRSAKPDVDYSTARLVQFFQHFMDGLGISQATLIGNSMGAGLAMAVALEAPQRVNSLVLISGFPPNPRDSVSSAQYKRFLNHRPPLWLAKLGNWFAGKSATRTVLEEIVYNQELLTPAVIARSYHNRQTGNILPPLFSLMDHIDDWEQHYGNRLSEIQAPTLVLWGEKDRVFFPKVGKALYALLPNAKWELIPNAGHLLQWEAPEQVNSSTLSFLATHK